MESKTNTIEGDSGIDHDTSEEEAETSESEEDDPQGKDTSVYQATDTQQKNLPTKPRDHPKWTLKIPKRLSDSYQTSSKKTRR